MKKLICLLILGLSVSLSATECRYSDGKIVFAIAESNGEYAFTELQREKLIDEYGSADDVTPTDFEVAVSTCVGKFVSRSDFLSCFTKEGLFQRLSKMRSDFDTAIDLGDTQRARLIR